MWMEHMVTFLIHWANSSCNVELMIMLVVLWINSSSYMELKHIISVRHSEGSRQFLQYSHIQ